MQPQKTLKGEEWCPGSRCLKRDHDGSQVPNEQYPRSSRATRGRSPRVSSQIGGPMPASEA